MVRILVNNTHVEFPYDPPYGIQKSYMEKVLDCLDQKRHGVLESPTGTGKTLCLFSPITAWVQKKKMEKQQSFEFDDTKIHDASNPAYTPMEIGEGNSQQAWGFKSRAKIWYTSRTHSQIAQTISEVRKCNIEGLNVTVMGARDQLCINPNVLEEKDSYVKTIKCKELVKAKKCRFYQKMSYEKDPNTKFYLPGKVMDIEDMVSAGKECGLCPYYMAKKGHESADIVLLPYNYIIDKESRDANSLHLQNDVIVFDEGHNVPSTCEESYEFTFTSAEISLGVQNIKDLMKHLANLNETTLEEEIPLQLHASNSMLVLDILQKLEENLEKLKVSNDLMPITSLYKFLEESGLQGESVQQVSNAIEGFKNDSIPLSLTNSILSTFYLVERVINVIFGPAVKSFDSAIVERSFKWSITIDTDRVNKSKKISLFCFNPSFGVRALLQLGVQSIIITSGTLSPLKTFIYELDLPKPITLENQHIARKCQVPFVILGTGVGNVKMDATFKNRSEPQYISSLGNTLTNLISSIPDGVLMLFSSYSMMQNLKEAWESPDLGIWNRLNTLKRVFVEPRGKDEFINCMENYRRAIDSGNGAILMGVLRGKISEGMDFKDQYCRGVFIIGVPFPPVQDPRVKGKEKYAESLFYLNEQTKREEKLYKNSFMSVEAMKATNQAIGRVIRHGRDYGAIILLDYRFCWPRLFSNVSKWLRSETPVEKNFPETKRLLREFFKNVHLGKLGVEEIRRQAVDENGSPIANYVGYDEYDHKTAVPRITLQTAEDAKPREGNIRTDPRNVKVRSAVEYEDQEDVISSYRKSNAIIPKPEKEPDPSSFLDALQSSNSRSLGFREFNFQASQSNLVESCKRKYSSEDNDRHRLNKSPSLLTSKPYEPRKGSAKLRVKRFGHFETGDSQEPETINLDDKKIYAVNFFKGPEKSLLDAFATPSDKKKEAEARIMTYFTSVSKQLPEEESKAFKKNAWLYMRGESTLSGIVSSMRRILALPSGKQIFKDFIICVKPKDRPEWDRICNEINL